MGHVFVQYYLEDGLALSPGAGKGCAGFAGATGWGFAGRYSGPFCPQAPSRLTSATALHIALQRSNRSGMDFTIRITV
jgi:hypothetical protein